MIEVYAESIGPVAVALYVIEGENLIFIAVFINVPARNEKTPATDRITGV